MNKSLMMRIGSFRPSANGPWLALPGVLFLSVCFLYPVISTLLISIRGAKDGAFTLINFERLFATPLYINILFNTLSIAFFTTLLSVLLGYPVAFWLSKLPPTRRKWMIWFVIIPFWTSYLVKTFSWLLLLGYSGAINRTLVGAGIFENPTEFLYGRNAVLLGMVHALLPLAVLTMLPVMLGINRTLLSAAQSLGATPIQSFWRVFVPLSVPGASTAGLLVFISSLGFFITPALLGGLRDVMIAQIIIEQIRDVLNWEFAGALSVLLVVTALAGCWVYDRLFGLSSISGAGTSTQRSKAGASRAIGLKLVDFFANLFATIEGWRLFRGRGAYVLNSYVMLHLLFLIAPVLLVLPMSFTSSNFLSFPPPGFSLKWYGAFWHSSLWFEATIRSFVVGALTGVASTFLAGCAAIALVRFDSRWRSVAFGLFIAPIIVPRVVIGLGLLYFFSRLNLVGTEFGLVVGHTIIAIPFTFAIIVAVLKNYDWRLDQAAAVLGANRLRVLKNVTIPLIKNGLIAGFLFAFITSFDELTVAIFVAGGSKTTLPRQMWDDMILQINPTLAAASVIVFLIGTLMMLIAEYYNRRARQVGSIRI